MTEKEPEKVIGKCCLCGKMYEEYKAIDNGECAECKKNKYLRDLLNGHMPTIL